MLRCDTEAMKPLYLAEIATQIAPGAHAALTSSSQAGGIFSGRLTVPINITVVHCRQGARSPRPPQENGPAVHARPGGSRPHLQILRPVHYVDHCAAMPGTS